MRTIIARLGVAALAFVVAVAHLTGQATDSTHARALAAVRRAIDAGNAQWSAGWATRNAQMVAAVFAADGVQLSGTGAVIKGPSQIAARQKTAMLGADSGVKVTITTTHVWLDGTIAYETGKYKYEYTDHGTAAADTGRYVTVWKRQHNGTWKLAMDMGVPQG